MDDNDNNLEHSFIQLTLPNSTCVSQSIYLQREKTNTHWSSPSLSCLPLQIYTVFFFYTAYGEYTQNVHVHVQQPFHPLLGSESSECTCFLHFHCNILHSLDEANSSEDLNHLSPLSLPCCSSHFLRYSSSSLYFLLLFLFFLLLICHLQ
jgi:hypothetical protein